MLDAFTAGFVSAMLFGERFDTSDDAEDDPEGCARMDRTAKGLAGKLGSACLGDDGKVYVSSC